MARKRQVTVYLDEDVEKMVDKQLKISRNGNISSVINDAIRYAAFPEHRQDRDADLYKMMQVVMDSFVQHRKKTARDLAFIQEVCLESLQEFYRHNLEIPESQKKERDVKARARTIAFVENIVRHMPELKSFSEKERGE
jgi:Arc/MetJ-type ribon-helix-helix transcriptional regulator